MKNLLIILSVFILGNPVFSQEKNVQTSSEIKQVNLFLQGAQIMREAQFDLGSGISRVVLDGITNQLDPSSIQVSSKSNFIILSVSSKNSVVSNPKKLPIINMLEDSLEILQYQLEEERNQRFVLEQQESLLLTNKNLKGDKGVVLIDLEDALIIYQKQLTQIKKGQLDSRIQERKLSEKIRVMNAQLAEFKRSNLQPAYEVIVTVSSSSSVRNAKLELSYYVSNATWQPMYDIRVADLKSPVALQYKAEIANNTGENWENIQLHLSSGNPNLSGLPPVLNTQKLYYTDRQNPAPGKMNMYNSYRGNNATYSQDYEDQAVTYQWEAGIQQQNTNFSFMIPSPVNVPATGQAVSIDLQSHKLNGSYSHFSIPKMEQSAFLLTNISGWEDLNLLNGKANIYFESTFLGTTIIEPGVTSDTLNVSLGRDKGVIVERNKLPEFCTTNFSGSRKKEVVVYEITVKNTKKESIQLTIEDQIPVATNKEIDVEVKEVAGANYDKETGKLTWIKTIAPGETVKIRVNFEVKFPKDKVLKGL